MASPFDPSIKQSLEAFARIHLSSPRLIDLKRGSRSKSMTPSSASFSALSSTSLSMPSQPIGARSPSLSDHSDIESPKSSVHHSNAARKAMIAVGSLSSGANGDSVYSSSSLNSAIHPAPSSLSSSQMETESEADTPATPSQSKIVASKKDHAEGKEHRRSDSNNARPSSILCHPFTAINNTHRFIFTAQLHNSLFGAVRLAFDRLSLQQVSVKISAKSCYENSLTRHRVRVMENVKREAFVMKLIQEQPYTENHPGGKYLTKFVEEYEDKYYHYLITEYAMAGDLFSILMTLPEHRLGERKARVIFRQLVKGIALLHELGMAHTDISLENVVLNEHGEVRLIDFGVTVICEGAPLIEECGPKTRAQIKAFQTNYQQIPSDNSRLNFLIAPGTVKPGKVSYMSPELYQGHAWDAQANDCFALGVILYSITTGRPPFECAGERDGKLDVWFDALYSGKWIEYLSQYDTKKYAHIYVYAHLSEECLDLLDRLFTRQEDRLNIHEILDHPWTKKPDDE